MAFNWGGLLGGLVGAGTGAFNSAQNARISRENTERTIQANKEAAELAFQRDYWSWNMANKYNSPEEQMGRLSAAGLNPNLVYGSGTVAGNSTTSRPSYKPPRYDYNNVAFNVPDLAATQLNFRQGVATLDNVKQQNTNLKAQADAIKVDTLNKSVDTLNKAVSYGRGKLDYDTAKSVQSYNIEAAKLGVEQARSSLRKTDTETALREAELSFKPKEFQILNQKLQNLKSDYDLMDFKKSLNKLGLTDRDGLLWRLIGTAVNRVETWPGHSIFSD